jgi:lipoprotein-releasing system permease protein
VIRPVAVFIALRYLTTKRKNKFASFVSIASILGIALGVAVLIIVSSVMNGFEKEVTRHILGMTSHALLFKPGARIPDWRNVIDVINADPNVVAAAPLIRAGAMLNHKGTVRGVAVQGIDSALERAVSTLPDTVGADAMARLDSAAGGIILGKSLAETLDVDIGNTVTLIAPRWSEQYGIEIPRYVPLKVVSTFSVGMHEFDASIALLNLSQAAEIFEHGNDISAIRILFTDPKIAPQRSLMLAEQLGGGYTAVNWTQYHRNFFFALKSQKRIMFVILSLIVAVAAFNIVASMIMIVKEKERDIAVLRTLGLSPPAVMFVFILQGVLIGLLGVILGVLTGACGAQQAHRFVTTIENWFGIKFIKPDVYYIDYLPAHIQINDILIISITAFLICVTATLYPAWRAARTSPAFALRYE